MASHNRRKSPPVTPFIPTNPRDCAVVTALAQAGYAVRFAPLRRPDEHLTLMGVRRMIVRAAP